jgi:hypothetical protein
MPARFTPAHFTPARFTPARFTPARFTPARFTSALLGAPPERLRCARRKSFSLALPPWTKRPFRPRPAI